MQEAWGDQNNRGNSQKKFSLGRANPNDLQQMLSEQMIEKNKLEQEFYRMGNKSRTKNDIEKKKAVEQQLETSNA